MVDGTYAKSGSKVYFDLAKQYNVTKQSMYLSIKRHIMKVLELREEDIQRNESSEDEYTPISNLNIHPEDSVINFDLNSVDLFETEGKRRNGKEIAAVLVDILWDIARLPCCWKFTRLQKPSDEYHMRATCGECGGKLHVFTECGQKILKMVIQSVNEKIVHLSKRRHTVHDEEVDELIKSHPASVVRSKLANNLMTEYDYEPAHLATTNALRIRKCKQIKSTLLDDDPVIAICKMKKVNEYKDCIGDVGLSPFYCMYATQLQREWLRLESRYQRTILSIDSTGISVQPPRNSSISDRTDRLKTIFLYALTLHGRTMNLPVFQVLSQRHTSNFIRYFLSCWKKDYFGNKNPHEVIMDDSSALLLATVQEFTGFKTLNHYLNACYEAIFTQSPPPISFIRLDRSHVVKNIVSMPFLKNVHASVRIFFRRIFGFLILCDDINFAEKIMESTFIMIHNKRFSEDVLKARKFLKASTLQHQIDLEIDSDQMEDSSSESDEFHLDGSSANHFRNWLEEINKKVKENASNGQLDDSAESADGLVENLFNLPTLEKPTIDFFSRIGLYSNVMCRVFNSNNETATSSPTEVGFKNIKKVYFNNDRNIRVDRFVSKHIDLLQGNMKLALSESRRNDEANKTDMSEDAEIDLACRTDETFEENWRKKNVDAEKVTHKQTKRCATSILEPSKPFCKHVPILKNGYCYSGSKKVATTITTMTCAFDSIFQVYAAFYTDISMVKAKFDVERADFTSLVKDLFYHDIGEIYKRRNDLLIEFLPESVIKMKNNIQELNCEISINPMFLKIAERTSVINSIKEIKSCDVCSTSKNKFYTFVPLKLDKVNLSQLEDCLVMPRDTTCSCGKQYVRKLEYNSIVAFDIERSLEEQSPVMSYEIQQDIRLNNENYELRAIISHTPGHFKSNVRRNNGNWETYDDLCPKKSVKFVEPLTPTVLFYSIKDDLTLLTNEI